LPHNFFSIFHVKHSSLTSYFSFKAIPKLAFHRPTENRHDNVCKPAPFIPGHNTVLIAYWAYIIYVGMIVTVFSCIKGVSVQNENVVLYKLSQGILLITLGIANVICVLGLVKYGRLLVVLTTESVILVSGGGGKEKQQTHKTHLKKVIQSHNILFYLKN
jgi:hypothetical protein